MTGSSLTCRNRAVVGVYVFKPPKYVTVDRLRVALRYYTGIEVFYMYARVRVWCLRSHLVDCMHSVPLLCHLD